MAVLVVVVRQTRLLSSPPRWRRSSFDGVVFSLFFARKPRPTSRWMGRLLIFDLLNSAIDKHKSGKFSTDKWYNGTAVKKVHRPTSSAAWRKSCKCLSFVASISYGTTNTNTFWVLAPVSVNLRSHKIWEMKKKKKKKKRRRERDKKGCGAVFMTPPKVTRDKLKTTTLGLGREKRASHICCERQESKQTLQCDLLYYFLVS